MAFITTGLTNGGITTHYAFSYDEALRQTTANPTGPEPARTNAVIAACETDYALMSGWFGGGLTVTGMAVQVTTQSNGAQWNGSSTSSTIQLKPGGASYTNNPEYLRYLLISEVTEIFMMTQNAGWFQGSDEGSKGEGLSRFLGARFLDINGFADLQLRTDFGTARLWLNSSRGDFVNNAPDDNGDNATNGCTTLFIWYLFAQLGFSEQQIVAAAGSTLADVYRTLTGDSGDPFPFFKSLLDANFPSTTGSAIPGPNPDNPWPLARLSFWVDKSSYGRDEVHDLVTPPNTGTFPEAFWLVVEGLNRQVLGGATPTLSGTATAFPGISMSPSASGTEFEAPGDLRIPQRVRFPFDVRFTAASLGGFPGAGAAPVTDELDGALTVGGHTARAATLLEFTSGADPYFTNINPAQRNVFWLSQDLRVFTAIPALHNHPVPAGPAFATDSFTGAYVYLQALLGYLNSNFGNPSGTDPFDPANNVVPGQSGALTGDSSVTPSTGSHRNYNFAIARVRLRGTQGTAGAAQNVKVFFRMWGTQTADTDYQPDTTYLSRLDASNLPASPLAPPDNHTIPMFATGTSPNLLDPNNPEYGTGGVNNQTITIATGDSQWAYFGCFLNVYDPSNTVNGTPVRMVLPGTHHCLVAQLAYDPAPIINANGITASPSSSDKLAQRNLQVTVSDNPGSPATHLIPQTFDLRPSEAAQIGDLLSGYPDELMIDWGNTPVGSTATIYWPQVDAVAVLALAGALYPAHRLTAADPHTLRCPVTAGVTYLPIPAGTGPRLAGLLTVDLPATVVKGQEFNVIVRRVRTRRLPIIEAPRLAGPQGEGLPASVVGIARVAGIADGEPQPDPGRSIEGYPGTPIAKEQRPVTEHNWRYVTGSFQVRIPVSTANLILPAELDTLAIFKWRLLQTSPTNRWYPVLQRYLELLVARVRGLGGDPDAVPPSPDGAPRAEHHGDGHAAIEGTVLEVSYDCTGRIEAFVVGDCCHRHTLHTAEPELGVLLLEAMRRRLRIAVATCADDRHRIERVVLRP